MDERDIERFWSKVQRGDDDACWPWAGAPQPNGYGRFKVKGFNALAHRISHLLVKGEIPDGLVIDHLCRNRICVNPSHLEAVTCRENLLRGETWQAANARKTHCPHGHPYDEANTRINRKGSRVCIECARRTTREWMRAHSKTWKGPVSGALRSSEDVEGVQGCERQIDSHEPG